MKTPLFLSLSFSLVTAAALYASDQPKGREAQEETDAVKEHGKVVHETNPDFGKLKANRPSRGTGISYHGGPVILNGVNVYLIWYGNWSGNTATTIIKDFLSAEGGSPYFNINSTYYSGGGTVLNSVVYKASTTDSYSQGTSLSDAQIQAVVSSAISSGALPKDANGVYFVL